MVHEKYMASFIRLCNQDDIDICDRHGTPVYYRDGFSYSYKDGPFEFICDGFPFNVHGLDIGKDYAKVTAKAEEGPSQDCGNTCEPNPIPMLPVSNFEMLFFDTNVNQVVIKSKESGTVRVFNLSE